MAEPIHYGDQVHLGWLLDAYTESAHYLLHGLAELQRVGHTADLEPLATMQLLASGLERLAKVIHYLALCADTGAPPTWKHLSKTWGKHDIAGIIHEIAALQLTASDPAVQADVRFLREDHLVREMLQLLSRFGDGDRFWSLDLARGQPARFESEFFKLRTPEELAAHPELDLDGNPDRPEEAWLRLLHRAAHREAKADGSRLLKFQELMELGSGQVVRTIERLVRALNRAPALCVMRTAPGTWTAPYERFQSLTDAQLGTHSYVLELWGDAVDAARRAAGGEGATR